MKLADLIEIGVQLFKTLTGHGEDGYVLPQPRAPAQPGGAMPPQPVDPNDSLRPRADRPLTANFRLYELTETNNAALQAKNRTLTDEQVGKLTEVAELLEKARAIIGTPVSVHSGYRCPELNSATPGSALKSQHMLCEAADFSEIGSADSDDGVNAAFQKLWDAGKRGDIKFGQLIKETAQRSYGRTWWVHISLGAPYRDPARLGEVLTMQAGQDGKPQYVKIGNV